MRIGLLVFFIFAAFVCVFFIQQSIDREKGAYYLLEEMIYFPSGTFVKEIAVGFDVLVADLVWLRAIQYFGEHHMTDLKFEHLYHILDILTTLDEKFIHAYTFGGLLLEHSARESDNADILLHKGEVHNPLSWEIPFIRGFIYYVFRDAKEQAISYFMRAAAKPDAPDMCKRFAGFTYQKLGDAFMAYKLWEDIYSTSRNELERETAYRSMQEMVMLMEMDSLNMVIGQFKKNEGRLPETITEMIEQGYLDGALPTPWEGERLYLRKDMGKAWCTYLDRITSPMLNRMLKDMGYPIEAETKEGEQGSAEKDSVQRE